MRPVFLRLFNHDWRHPSYLFLKQKIVVKSSGHVSHAWIHFLPLWVRRGVNCRHVTLPTYWCGICELMPQIPQCSFWLDKPCGNDCFRCKQDVHSVYPIKCHQSFEGCWKDTMMIFERNFFNTTNRLKKKKKGIGITEVWGPGSAQETTSRCLLSHTHRGSEGRAGMKVSAV